MVEMQIVCDESGAIDAASLNGMNESYLWETVKEDFKPFVGQEFVSVDEATNFYKIYALSIGFDIRRFSEHKWYDGTLKTKLIVYNREGKYKAKKIILSNIKLNIGATKTYRMIKEHVKGFENIGATLNHFKNFQRDMKCFIHERDDQLLIDRFKSMEENVPDFFFDYDVDEDGSLRRVIWADGMGRRNYQLFGKAISFDPTYSTNKYSMVFTPFTGVDNHKRNCPYPFVESAAVVDNSADDNGKRVDEV